ncbi:MAG: hypothetical protein IJP07_00905 [Firmicutes bacterium]|nr:hypothetical protein [Bacillota bacterium]
MTDAQVPPGIRCNPQTLKFFDPLFSKKWGFTKPSERQNRSFFEKKEPKKLFIFGRCRNQERSENMRGWQTAALRSRKPVRLPRRFAGKYSIFSQQKLPRNDKIIGHCPEPEAMPKVKVLWVPFFQERDGLPGFSGKQNRPSF